MLLFRLHVFIRLRGFQLMSVIYCFYSSTAVNYSCDFEQKLHLWTQMIFSKRTNYLKFVVNMILFSEWIRHKNWIYHVAMRLLERQFRSTEPKLTENKIEHSLDKISSCVLKCCLSEFTGLKCKNLCKLGTWINWVVLSLSSNSRYVSVEHLALFQSWTQLLFLKGSMLFLTELL